MAVRNTPNTASPTLVPLVGLFDTDLGTSVRGLDIFEDGVVSVVDIDNNTVTQTFLNVAPFARWAVQVKKILPATTVDDTKIVGLL